MHVESVRGLLSQLLAHADCMMTLWAWYVNSSRLRHRLPNHCQLEPLPRHPLAATQAIHLANVAAIQSEHDRAANWSLWGWDPVSRGSRLSPWRVW